MTVGDRVVLTMPLRDVDPGVRGTITEGPGGPGSGYLDGFIIKFDGFERPRILPPMFIEPLGVLDALAETL